MILHHQSPASIRAPFGRYVHMVEVAAAARMLILSGQLGIRADGTVPDDVGEQAAQAFANIDACLEAAAVGRAQLLRLTVYLTEADYRVPYMQVRDAWVADPPPASTLVIVKALALPACKVEIEAIAAV